jgi:hypothetical protein
MLINEDMKSAFLMFKFGENEHMQKLYEEGEIYLNTISFFKITEDQKLRGDKHENITHNWQSDQIDLKINGQPLKDIVGSVKVYNPQEDKYQFTHIYSMSALCWGDNLEGKKILDERMKGFGNSVVIINNVKEFLARLEKTLDKLCPDTINRLSTDVVKYYDPNKHHGDLDIFCKSDEYSYQREWRIGVAKKDNIQNDFSFKIGNIKDISTILKIEDFRNEVSRKDGKINLITHL